MKCSEQNIFSYRMSLLYNYMRPVFMFRCCFGLRATRHSWAYFSVHIAQCAVHQETQRASLCTDRAVVLAVKRPPSLLWLFDRCSHEPAAFLLCNSFLLSWWRRRYCTAASCTKLKQIHSHNHDCSLRGIIVFRAADSYWRAAELVNSQPHEH